MTLKTGVIGTGVIGQQHIARLDGKLSGSIVVAFDGANAENARAVAARLCVETSVHASGQALVADAVVDSVVVTS